MESGGTVWAKVTGPDTETLLAMGAGWSLEATLSREGLVSAVMSDLRQDREFRLNAPVLSIAIEAFCNASGAYPPPEAITQWGTHVNEAYLETDQGAASIRQTSSGTILKVSSGLEAWVPRISMPFDADTRRSEMVSMLPDLLRMAEEGLGEPPRTSAAGGVSSFLRDGVLIPCGTLDDRPEPLLDGEVLGLTPEGWVVTWSSEHNSLMTGFLTPEEFGLHRFSFASYAEAVGIDLQIATEARRRFQSSGGIKSRLSDLTSVVEAAPTPIP